MLATVFGIDSKRFVSAGRDRAAKLIDAQSGAFLENVNLLRGELTAIARHPKKDIVVIGGEERYPYIYLMDRPRNMKIADDTTLVRKLERQDGAITALTGPPTGRASLSLALHRPSTCTTPKRAIGKRHAQGTRPASTPSLSLPMEPQLATGGFDGKVRIYKTSDCTLLHSFIPVPLSAGPTHSAGLTRPYTTEHANETPHGIGFRDICYAGPPTLTELQPRGAQKGRAFKLTLAGTNLGEGAASCPRCPPPSRR